MESGANGNCVPNGSDAPGTLLDDGSAKELGLVALREQLRKFRRERDWAKYHTPRNLTLALVGEVGELAELFQWRSDEGAQPGLANWTEREREHLGEEIADVLLYLVQVADVCGVDLPAVVPRKIGLNAKKYPAPSASDGRTDQEVEHKKEDVQNGAADTDM